MSMDKHDDIFEQDDSMIKYFREKIIGRSNLCEDSKAIPTVHLSEENVHQIDNQLIETDLVQRTTHSTTSPITIPKKPVRTTISTPTSSSASLGESSSVPSVIEKDDNLLVLPSPGQQLQHTAARDRISVKNARRQPIKQKLSALTENDDQDNNKPTVLSSTPTDDESIVPPRTEVKAPQPLIDLSDINSARARLRMSVRTRDRSADNLLLAKTTNQDIETHSTESPLTPKLPSVIQRSVSFKRPQDISEKSSSPRPSILRKIDNNETTMPSPSSSQEHIYDNLDVFKKEISDVKTRENSGRSSIRLRPVTMHVSTPLNEDSSKSNEFEQIFNQFKTRGSIRRVRVQEEKPTIIPPEPEPTPPPPVPVPIAVPVAVPVPTEPEVASEPTPIVKTPTVLPSPQPAPRRKTLGGVHLSGTHKVASEEPKPTPSWIDIAKQKQNKFQSVSNESKTNHDETHQEIIAKSPVIIRKTTPSSETRLNRQSMFEATTTSNTHPIERDSIRALKAGNPNRINNLIQFFDK